MEVVCPQCNALYNVPDNKVPAAKAVLICKRCQHRIPVKPIFSTGSTLKMSPEEQAQADQIVVPKSSASHSSELLRLFPQAANFDPNQYRLANILAPNKKGDYQTRLNTLKIKLLTTAKPVLDRLLDTDEHVACIAAATAYYPLEILLGNGWLTLLYNRYILVATGKRMVALNTNYKMNKTSHYFFQFPYNALKKVSKGLFGTSLTLARKHAKRRTFAGIKAALAGEMKAWITSRIGPDRAIDSAADQCDNLCPNCFAPLDRKVERCPICQAAFKSPPKAALRSLLLPGWGDLYLGHRLLGAIELAGAIFVWIFALGMIVSGESGGVTIGLVLLLFVNGLDALLSLHMAKKGLALDSAHP